MKISVITDAKGEIVAAIEHARTAKTEPTAILEPEPRETLHEIDIELTAAARKSPDAYISALKAHIKKKR